MPMFTAEAALPKSNLQFQERWRGPGGPGVTSQQFEIRGRRAPIDPGGEVDSFTTCTCPCCQQVGGVLRCC